MSSPYTNKLLLISMLPIILVGCASTQQMGYGTVIAEKKIAERDYSPKSGTVVGAGVGAGAGAATGAYIGAATGLAAGTIAAIGTFGIGYVYIPAFTAVGALGGAAIGAAAGSATGAGVGYAADIYQQGNGVYQYTVKPDNQSQNISVTQYTKSPIAKKSRVKIMLQGDKYSVEAVN
ncbi:MAG TPA: hypothetical protein VL360_06240 [Gammaproteobacteria bacterium]|jgi:hypothetical protein|nr:hypothetical protein [Gammaproteobacteria bacterium]